MKTTCKIKVNKTVYKEHNAPSDKESLSSAFFDLFKVVLAYVDDTCTNMCDVSE